MAKSKPKLKLTGRQEEVLEQVISDVTSAVGRSAGGRRRPPVPRLLRADVGSGKTIVAVRAIRYVLDHGYHAVFLCPTSTLVDQHLAYIRQHDSVAYARCVVLSGRVPASERRTAEWYASSRDPRDCSLFLGTTAVCNLAYARGSVGLLVVDEQQRFGVEVRDRLSKDQGCASLVLTATPIPRTQKQVEVGDVVASTLPPLRERRVRSLVCRHSGLYGPGGLYARYVPGCLESGGRVYLVFASVDSDGTDGMELLSLEKGESRFLSSLRRSRAADLRGSDVCRLTGPMSPEDRDRSMRGFLSGRCPVLACTSVVEVGVHCDEASLMIVHNAEMFGSSQLHQFRGRVGRLGQPSVFVMASDSDSPSSLARFRSIRSTTSGRVVSSADLRRRGPGLRDGPDQHGPETTPSSSSSGSTHKSSPRRKKTRP